MTGIRLRVTQLVWPRILSVALAFISVVRAPDLLSDTLIINARVIDGTGAKAINGSVRISGARIVAVGKLAPTESDTIIDARGLVLAPGFIDTHSHSDRLILTERDALAKITQGITTAVVGQDGDSPFRSLTFMQRWRLRHPKSILPPTPVTTPCVMR